MEAILCNKPVIISDAANRTNLVVNNKNGLIFKNNNTRSLIKKMYQVKENSFVIDDDERKKFIKRHTLDNITKKYLHIFQSLIHN